MIRELQAKHEALLATLKQTSSADGQAVLSGERFAYYQEQYEKNLRELTKIKVYPF